jgi:hypothetical protein
VLTAAERHAVLPLLYYHLAEHLAAIPQQVFDQLRRKFELNALRNSLLTNELCKLLRLFAEHDISVIAFKGPALSLALYNNLLLRQFGDLDLFINRSDLARMTALLDANGYDLNLSPAEQKYFLRYRYHFNFIRRDGKVVVEVHWAFTPRCWPFRLDEQLLWKQSTSLDMDGTPIPCLSPEHCLLALCAHGGKERWARLQLVTDVCELIRKYRINWDWILVETERIKRERVLLLGLGLAQSLLGLELPEKITKRLARDDAVRSLVNGLCDVFFGHSYWPLTGIQLHTFFFRVWPTWRDRLGYVRNTLARIPKKLEELVTPCKHDRDLLRLPHRLRFVYYGVRAARLAVRYRNPVRLLTRLLDYL